MIFAMMNLGEWYTDKCSLYHSFNFSVGLENLIIKKLEQLRAPLKRSSEDKRYLHQRNHLCGVRHQLSGKFYGHLSHAFPDVPLHGSS